VLASRAASGAGLRPIVACLQQEKCMDEKKVEMVKVKKIVVNKLNTRTGIKALGGSQTNNSCTGAACHTK
jgi:hypothetical protein